MPKKLKAGMLGIKIEILSQKRRRKLKEEEEDKKEKETISIFSNKEIIETPFYRKGTHL